MLTVSFPAIFSDSLFSKQNVLLTQEEVIDAVLVPDRQWALYSFFTL